MTRAGGTLVATEKFDRNNTSIISAAERLKARGGYDAVLIADGVRLSVMAAGRLREGAQPKLLGTELWSNEPSLASSAALRGALFSAVSDRRLPPVRHQLRVALRRSSRTASPRSATTRCC